MAFYERCWLSYSEGKSLKEVQRAAWNTLSAVKHTDDLCIFLFLCVCVCKLFADLTFFLFFLTLKSAIFKVWTLIWHLRCVCEYFMHAKVIFTPLILYKCTDKVSTSDLYVWSQMCSGRAAWRSFSGQGAGCCCHHHAGHKGKVMCPFF